MKTTTLRRCFSAMLLATLPLLGGCGLDAAAPDPEPVTASLTNEQADPVAEVVAVTNDVPAEEGALDLEKAPGKIVSVSDPPRGDMSSPAAEVAKLAQAGVDESVMLAFVTNSTYTFNLTSDHVIYLNDIGVPESVIAAMLQQDRAGRAVAPGIQLSTAPGFSTNQYDPGWGAPTPYSNSETTTTMTEPEPAQDAIVEPQPANVSYTYFYDSLAPYGNWVNVSGYGYCWQPTVVVANPGWRPYCDRGRWVYSDCGWYWTSDYSWGWAPFHYGRWFCHSRWGWCWAPDTVWGPSWVSWRYGSDYCGWAPLPPSACYTPGSGFTHYGRHVGHNFDFGLTASHYSFVPTSHFYDRSLNHHRLPVHENTRAFNRTMAMNQVVQGDNNTVINRGIPVSHIASATHSEIQPVRIRGSDTPIRTRIEGSGPDRTLAIFRPNLPVPDRETTLVGEGVKPAQNSPLTPRALNSRANQVSGNGAANPIVRQNFTPRQNRPATDTALDNPRSARNEAQLENSDLPPSRRPVDPVSPGRNQPFAPVQPGVNTANPNPGVTVRNQNSPQRNAPIVLRGSSRPAASPNNGDAGAPNQPNPVVRNNPNFPSYMTPSATVIQPQQPLQPTPPTQPAAPTPPVQNPVRNNPVHNNPTVIVPNRQQQFTPPAWQAPRQSQPNYQDQTPRVQAPVQNPVQAPVQTPPAPVQRQAPTVISPGIPIQQPPQSSPPVQRSGPRAESTPPAAPRSQNVEVASVRSAQSPPPQNDKPQSSSRQERQERQESRRNR